MTRPAATIDPGDPPDLAAYKRKMQIEDPEARPRNVSDKERTLELATGDDQRVNRAWAYIYSHGCVGQKSPF
jgi:hypothetical protein